MVKFATGALLAALLCFATPARADSSTLLDPKVDLLRKAVQALPADKVADALNYAAESASLKAGFINGTLAAEKGGPALEPVVKLLAHAVEGKAWLAEELAALAGVFRDSVDEVDLPVTAASEGVPGEVELVNVTSADAADAADAAGVGKAAAVRDVTRPPLPVNPPGTKVIAVGDQWEVVPMTAADMEAGAASEEEEAVGGAEAATTTAGPPAAAAAAPPDQQAAALAAVARRAGRTLLQSGGRRGFNPRTPGDGPLSPASLTPSQAQRVAALEKKGLSTADALAAVAATPGSSVKVAYVWFLLQKDVDAATWIVADAPELSFLPQPAFNESEAATAGRRRLSAVTPVTVWAGNNALQSTPAVYTPPDGALAVGNGFILQANNAFLTIRSATTGAVVSGPISLKTLFGSSTINFGDPRAMYDPVAGRFIINAYGVSGLSSWTYLATSKGSNPTTSGWWVFRVTNDVRTWSGCSATTRCFGDYPTLGQDRNSVWITTNQFSQLSGGSYSFAGVGIWGLSKTALVAGKATVPNYRWFLPYRSAYSFTMQPAKASEATSTGKMHFMAAYSNTYTQYMSATNTDRLNLASPRAPTLSGITYVPTGVQLPRPPNPISQANGDRLRSADGRMQMCTQAGNSPAANSPLYCTTDMSCQVNGVTLSCVYVAIMTPSTTSPFMTVTSRVVLSLADTHVFMGALAANPVTKQVGVVAIGVGRATATATKCASLFFRVDGNVGTIGESLAVAGSGYLYDWVDPGRVGDYNDAALDAANVFYGASENGYPTTAWQSTNWATNIFKTALT